MSRTLVRSTRGWTLGLAVALTGPLVLLLLAQARPGPGGRPGGRPAADRPAAPAPAPAPAPAAAPTTAPEGTRLKPVIVGSAIFPPRGAMERKSSAEYLFGISKWVGPEGTLEPLRVAIPGTDPVQYTTAVEMGTKALDFIRRSQQQDGSWGDKEWPQNVGVTSLCCLALFAEGNMPKVGPSGLQLARGLEFMLDHAKDDGQIVARDVYRHGPMYDHSWAALCLLQAYGNMPWRRDMNDKVHKAIQLLLKYQRVDGGWRYKMMREDASDALVTVNVLYTLRLGIRSGFAVPQESIDRALAYLSTRAMRDESGRFNGLWEYRPGGVPGSPTVAACGAIAHYMMAKKLADFTDPKVVKTVDVLHATYQRYSVDDLLAMAYIHYGQFYVSQATYVAASSQGPTVDINKYWHPYYKKALEIFAASQRPAGEFLDQSGNTVYTTASAAIVLLAPKGYLPLYLR